MVPHGTKDTLAIAYNQLVLDGKIDPVPGRTIVFDEIGQAHAAMGRGEDVRGGTTVLVGAVLTNTRRRLRTEPSSVESRPPPGTSEALIAPLAYEQR